MRQADRNNRDGLNGAAVPVSNNATKGILERCATMKINPHVPLLTAFVILAIAFIILNFFRSLSAVENALFQVFILGTGLLGSYIFGKNSARAGALDVVKPHARAAFRRVFALYSSLYRLSVKIEELKEGVPDHRLDLIQALVNEHISTGEDAIEDWRDLVPEEVDEIERRKARNE